MSSRPCMNCSHTCSDLLSPGLPLLQTHVDFFSWLLLKSSDPVLPQGFCFGCIFCLEFSSHLSPSGSCSRITSVCLPSHHRFQSQPVPPGLPIGHLCTPQTNTDHGTSLYGVTCEFPVHRAGIVFLQPLTQRLFKQKLN